MKWKIGLLVLFTLLIVFIQYAGGRWGWHKFEFAMLNYLMVCVTTVWVIFSRSPDRAGWNRTFLNVICVGACWAVLFLPIVLGDGYFEMGRRAHIRSLFTAELIEKVRSAAAKATPSHDARDLVKLAPEQLPAEVSASAWGAPGHASCTFDGGGRLTSVSLTWGGSLIGHHSLVLTDADIPFHGYPVHGGDTEEAQYFQRYYALRPGAYIMMERD